MKWSEAEHTELRRGAKWSMAFFGAFIISAILKIAGQQMAFGWFGGVTSSDQLFAFERTLIWIVFPLSSFFGGTFVGLSNSRLRGGYVAALGGAVPILTSWLHPAVLQIKPAEATFHSAVNVAIALAAFSLCRRRNITTNDTEGG